MGLNFSVPKVIMEVNDVIQAIENAKARLRANVNFDLVMELLLLTIKEN